MRAGFRRATMAYAILLFCAATLTVTWAAAGRAAPRQTDQDRTRGRDLVFETADRETVQLPTVPRGYALVIGGRGVPQPRRVQATAVRAE